MDRRIEKLQAVFGHKPFTAKQASELLRPNTPTLKGGGAMMLPLVQQGLVVLVEKGSAPSKPSLYAIPVSDSECATPVPVPAALVEQRHEVWALEFGRYLISPNMLVMMRYEERINLIIGNDTFAVSPDDWANRRLVNLADPAPPRVDADTEAMLTLLEEQEREIAKLKAQEAELVRRLNQVRYFLTQAEILDKPKEKEVEDV
jgi:hypothetical protein